MKKLSTKELLKIGLDAMADKIRIKCDKRVKDCRFLIPSSNECDYIHKCVFKADYKSDDQTQLEANKQLIKDNYK